MVGFGIRDCDRGDVRDQGDVTAAEVIQDACLDFLEDPPGFNRTLLDEVTPLPNLNPAVPGSS